jgi:hypothetical protein
MEKDPDVVARLAVAKEDENWQFRSFIKWGKPSRARLNQLAEQFGKQAETQMDCTTCGACCRDNCIPLSADGQARLAQHVGLSEQAFAAEYMTTDDDGEPAMMAQPCRFLDGTRCSVYEDRPDACRGYPYIGGDIPTRTFDMLERAATCPIVFEMLEQLKAALRFRPFR